MRASADLRGKIAFLVCLLVMAAVLAAFVWWGGGK
jgi:hypothetical protein